MNPNLTKSKQLGIEPLISQTARISDTRFGEFCEVGDRTFISETTVGDYSYIMHDCHVIYTQIGKFCSIANQVRINPGQHPLEHAALHHFTYRSHQYGMGGDNQAFFEGRRSRKVYIKEDVWIGHGAIVMPDVKIGTGAVIGAGSVVTKDVPEFTVVAGTPAKPIRERFSKEIQDALLEIKWWDWSKSELEKALPDFRSMSADAFVNTYG